MTYIEMLTNTGVNVPECYKQFRNSDEFDQYSGLVPNHLDRDVYSPTTQVHFDWDEHMFEELFDAELKEMIPIGILHDTEIVDDAYYAIRSDDPNCAVYHCEINDETNEVEVGIVADSLETFLDALNYSEDVYIDYLESKFKTQLPERYKQFIQSYEYTELNGTKKYDDEEISFDEFPNLKWAADTFNKDKLEWLPLASIGDEPNEYNDVIAIKMGADECPVYFINGDEILLISDSLNEFLA